MEREKVKQNINFLEYPLWFQDEIAAANAEQGMIWKDREGFVYRAGYKPPVKTDAIILLYLLMQSQKNSYSQELTLTRYQILNDCGLDVCAKSYTRLEDSLKRWKMVGIEFAGTFYDGESYSAINFGIIDSWSIHKKTKELKVVFSPSFIKMMLGKGFFNYINFAEFKKLRSPLATRLYEILCKSFHGRDLWEINAIKMAEKIPMKERYPAHIVPKIKTAINRINKCSDTNFLLETRKTDRGQTVLCFKKIIAAKTLLSFHQPEKESFTMPDKPEVIVLINLLPESRRSQKTILEPVIAFYEMRGADYVARNIRYTNKNAKSNYRPYLLKALQNDYGLAMQEDEEAARKIIAQETIKAKEIAQSEVIEQQRRKEQEDNKKRAQTYIESLSDESRSVLQAEALASMSDNIKEIVLKKGLGSKIMLNVAMESIALQRLAEINASKPMQPTLEMTA
ncbi:MAG: RepB family plasmid replication initiator protein [Clostridia bacterium]|nr:RepB family plasmid replication initiator protein [Clostridia bacterium]